MGPTRAMSRKALMVRAVGASIVPGALMFGLIFVHAPSLINTLLRGRMDMLIGNLAPMFVPYVLLLAIILTANASSGSRAPGWSHASLFISFWLLTLYLVGDAGVAGGSIVLYDLACAILSLFLLLALLLETYAFVCRRFAHRTVTQA